MNVKLNKEPKLVPHNAGLDSEPAGVAKRMSAILTALGNFGDNIASGQMVEDVREFRLKLHNQLVEEGWRIRATNGGWKVLQPRNQ